METLANVIEKFPWVLALWLGFIGACVGSFLNVVAYRLPLGLSLSHPGSFCPKCKSKIRPWHNVPVLGWLWLRGKCRDCRAAISPRYPLVEFVVGLQFAALAIVELFTFGQNLPQRDPHAPLLLDLTLCLTYLYHVTLVCTLNAAALMERDGNAIPRRLVTFALVVGIVPTLFWPGLRPVPFSREVTFDEPAVVAAIDALCGLAIGGVLAGAAVLLLPSGRRQVAWPLVWTCVFVGWQAGLFVGLATLALTLVVYGVGAIARKKILLPTAMLLLATLFLLVQWSWLAELWRRWN